MRVVPGWMQFTVMPNWPSCAARVFVMCTSEVLRAPPLRLPALRGVESADVDDATVALGLEQGYGRAGAAQSANELHVEVADQLLVDEVLDGSGG